MFNPKNEIHKLVTTIYENQEDYINYRVIENGIKKKYVCVFPAGNYFKEVRHVLENSFFGRIDFLSDNDMSKWGSNIEGYECISPNDLKKFKKDEVAVILCMRRPDDMKSVYEQLKQYGFDFIIPFTRFMSVSESKEMFSDLSWLKEFEDKTLRALEIFADIISIKTAIIVLQKKLSLSTYDSVYGYYDNHLSLGYPINTLSRYFPQDIFRFNNKESYVDAGAYIGDSIFEYLDQVKIPFERGYCFELSPNTYELLQINLKSLPSFLLERIETYNYGLSDKYKIVGISGMDLGCSSCEKKAQKEAIVVPLDSIIKNKEVSMIKFDIEGDEIPALSGAAEIIRDCHPKLAICAYHKFSDIYEIPLKIHELYNGYKIYLRHYSFYDWETICYATI